MSKTDFVMTLLWGVPIGIILWAAACAAIFAIYQHIKDELL